MNMQNDPVKCT